MKIASIYRYLKRRIRSGGSWPRNINVAPDALVHPAARLDVSHGGSITIESGCIIEQGCILDSYGGDIVVGRGVYLGPYCVIYGHGGLRIGSGTLVAAMTVVIPANHGFDGRLPIVAQPLTAKGIVVGDDCWLGCGVRVLDGVHIGTGCVVGAGAVVVRSLPDFSISVGVPARVVRTRCKDELKPSTSVDNRQEPV